MVAAHSASLVEPGSPEQVIGVASRGQPLGGAGGEPALHAEVVAAQLDPATEAVPFADECFVGDLDRGASGHRVSVEAEQAVPAKDIQDGAGPLTHRQQFASQHSPPDVVGIVTDRDQPEHHLTCRTLGEGIELAVEGLGAPARTAARPPSST